MALTIGKTFACKIVDSGSEVKRSAITVMCDGSFHILDPFIRTVVIFRPRRNIIINTVEGFHAALADENSLLDITSWMESTWIGTFLGLLVVLQQLHKRVDLAKWKDLETFHCPAVSSSDEDDFPLSLPKEINVEPFRRLLFRLPQLNSGAVDLTGERSD